MQEHGAVVKYTPEGGAIVVRLAVEPSASGDAHGGRMWADSAGEGMGTTLAVWLPLPTEVRSVSP